MNWNPFAILFNLPYFSSMNGTQFGILDKYLSSIQASLAQLVNGQIKGQTVLTQMEGQLVQLVTIQNKILSLQMTPQIVNALIAALVALTNLINTDASNVAAAQAAQKTAEDALAALQATDSALQDPALVAAAQSALDAAAAANPVAPTAPSA